MKRNVSKLRPSPNEESRLIREERERRRKLRIQQVREQQRYIALQIRQEVERRRQCELEQLGEELRQDWERQQREKLESLQRLYQESLQLLGQGHKSAKENEPDLAATAQKEEEKNTKAEQRYREALKELKSQRLKEHEMQTRAINARKMALQTEKERAAKVASLPPPPPNPIKQYIDSKKPQVVTKSDLRAFASTYYHMLESTVDRERHTEQLNAHEGAELESSRLQHLQKEERRKREEQLEKARLRGKEALRREQLMQDRERLLVELEHMQQTDLLRRRQQVSQMPPQIFQPLYKRHEMREDLQRDMEFAFEDMYTGERRIKGDLLVQLIPEPLPALSTSSQDQELDITMDEAVTPDTENTQPHAEQKAESNEQETVHVQSAKPKHAPRRALKKLLDRIRSQRSQWADHSRGAPAADSITAPEQDTTIDTGSLTSEEKDKLPPFGLVQPSHSPPALETTEDSTESETPVPCEEEERKKKEVELEKEKHQQLILLQELEEQKTKLEQLLLEAQQEREHLKAAVTLESTATQPAAPQHSVACTISSFPNEPPPAGEDDHTRRIRQYQQQLLEQKRSVKMADRRLEEHQEASTSAESTFIPGKMQRSVKVPTRESDTQVSTHRPTSSSTGVGSQLMADIVKTMPNGLRNQQPDMDAWLTHSIMDRVTEHLPDTVRPSSSDTEAMANEHFTIHQSANIPLQPLSRAAHPISQSITESSPALHVDARSGTVLPSFLQMRSLDSRDSNLERQQKLRIRSLSSGDDDLDSQRGDVHVWRGALTEPGQQREQRHGQEVQIEQMRRQKKALQALIHFNAQLVPKSEEEAQVLGNTKQSRLQLLASLLKAIEESNGGTLSHLEEHQEEDCFPLQSLTNHGQRDPIVQANDLAGPGPASVLPSGLHRATKPPVTRVRLGTVQMMTEQHELSVIQEVETQVDSSLITDPEQSVAASRVADSGGVWDVQEESESSVASDKALQPFSVSSCGSNSLAWRKRLLTGAGTSPELSKPAVSVSSPLSSDSGRGADTNCPSYTESPHRAADSDCLSSSTISTGSYITTEPEQNTDKCPAVRHDQEAGPGARFLDICSQSGQSFCIKQSSAAELPGLAVHSLFNDSSIQRIIEKYTKDLDINLSTAGRAGLCESSYVEVPKCSVQQSLVQAPERKAAPDTAGTQSSGQEYDRTGENPVQGSFRRHVVQLADESSCVVSTMARMVGHPSAHSSMIGLLPTSLDQGGWDSTLSRMIGRHSRWMSGGEDFYAGQLMGLDQSTTWLNGGQEESQMRPLVGELDEQDSENSGGSTEVIVPSCSPRPRAASSGSASVHVVTLQTEVQTLQNQMEPERTEAFSGLDSFHLLLAEVTHNETADPSLSFHLPEHDAPNSAADLSDTVQSSVSSPAHESGPQTDQTECSELSPEHLRTQEPYISQLSVCPATGTNVDLTARTLSHLSMCDAPDVSMPKLEEKDEHRNLNYDFPFLNKALEVSSDRGILEQSEITLVSLTDTTVQDQETAECGEGNECEEISKGQATKGPEFTLLPEEMLYGKNQTSPVTFLEFQWGPSTNLQQGVYQQKRAALLQKSSQRVEDIKAKGAVARLQLETQDLSAARKPSKPAGSPPVTCEAKHKLGPQLKNPNSNTGQPEQHQTERNGPVKLKKCLQPPPGSECGLQKVNEGKISTPELRKRDVSEMHQRTQRLYEQLEEVKHQRVIRSRQEAYAKNRLKAKEFHKKTLQKLRAKQTPQ